MRKPFSRFLPFIYIAIFFLLPIIIWFIGSINSAIKGDGLFIQYIIQFRNTLLISLLTSILTVLLTYPVSYFWFTLIKPKRKALLSLLIFSPVFFGLLTRNYAWIGLLSDKNIYSFIGLEANPFNCFLYTFSIVFLVMGYLFIPISYFILIQGFHSINISGINAGISMGANKYELFRRIIYPQTRKQIVISSFFIFANSIGFYVTPSMLGGGNYDLIGNVIERYLIDMGMFKEASILSMYLVVLVLPLIALSIFQIARDSVN